MNQSQFLALFKSSLAKFKITYWDPCTGQCVIGECDGGSGGTETLTTLNSVTLLPGNILQITYTGEDGIPQVRTTSLASLAQTITTLVDNGNGTFTYTSENGTVTTIDYSSSETTTTLTNTVTGSLIGTYTNELGVAVDINQTITSLVDNGNGTATFTNETGTSTTFPIGGVSVVDNGDGTYLITLPNGTSVTISDTSVSTLIDNGDNTFTYTDELGNTTTFTQGVPETQTTLDSAILTVGNVLEIQYTGENGLPQTVSVDLSTLAIDINVSSLIYNPLTGEIVLTETDGSTHTIDIGPFVETITILTDNNNGSFTYVNEAGTSVTWTETNTTITNTVIGNKIADYTSEDSTVTAINETITTISGNIYTNEAGTPTNIVQTVGATLDTNGDLIVSVNGVNSTPLDIPTIPTWKKEILDIVADNTIPNLGFLPVADSVILVYDGYTLCENLHYTISGQSITFNPANLGKDILVGELVHVQYQTII